MFCFQFRALQALRSNVRSGDFPFQYYLVHKLILLPPFRIKKEYSLFHLPYIEVQSHIHFFSYSTRTDHSRKVVYIIPHTNTFDCFPFVTNQ